ncbi:MAG: metalloregulator ArsR/SmtB family transcription factor [Victivallaceae bacterium]|nr:metalloregulator ArsR/SmtB family transcription factor [Victivallaceae bacterium]
MDDFTEMANFSRALSVEARVKIIDLLRDGPLCVGALSHRLGISQSAVSQHLRILKDAELVRAVRKGLFLHYEINVEIFSERLAKIKALTGTDKQDRKTNEN